jgi:hypothetical protein
MLIGGEGASARGAGAAVVTGDRGVVLGGRERLKSALLEEVEGGDKARRF